MTKYTKDNLIGIVIDNQNLISDQVKQNTIAFREMKSVLEQINDHNRLHAEREDARDKTVSNLVIGNEKWFKNNDKWYKLISIILSVAFAALVILAGAEKALQFAKFL